VEAPGHHGQARHRGPIADQRRWNASRVIGLTLCTSSLLPLPVITPAKWEGRSECALSRKAWREVAADPPQQRLSRDWGRATDLSAAATAESSLGKSYRLIRSRNG